MFLAAQSGWFKAAVSKAWHPSGRSTAEDAGSASAVPVGAARHELTVHLQPGEVAAMELLLRLMYGHDLPAVATDSIPLLFSCLRLADRFDAAACMELLLGHINASPVELAMLPPAYHVPPGVSDMPAYKQLLDSCNKFVLQRYNNVPAVIRDEQLRGEFCSLPFAAVLAWAGSDELQVHSENCVVYLLSAWVQAVQAQGAREGEDERSDGQGEGSKGDDSVNVDSEDEESAEGSQSDSSQGRGAQGVSSKQLEQLAHQVRVLHLGRAYQHHILPQLKWFQGCSGVAWLPALLVGKERDSSGKAVFMPTCTIGNKSLWKGPKQWLASPRKQCSMTDAEMTMKWELSGDQLQQLYNGQMCNPPTTFYISGFHLELCTSAQSPEGQKNKNVKTLGMFRRVKLRDGDCGTAWPDTAAVMVGEIHIKMLGGPGGSFSSTLPAFAAFGPGGRGFSDYLGKSAPTMSELLAPYLIDGKLQIEARFTTVDQP